MVLIADTSSFRLARWLRQWRRELVLARPTIIAALIKTNAITARTPPTTPEISGGTGKRYRPDHRADRLETTVAREDVAKLGTAIGFHGSEVLRQLQIVEI
jgi:hypothetical protein